MLRDDEAQMKSVDTINISVEEYERLIGGERIGANPAPAIEEGPHLKKADVREAKRKQLREAKIKADDERLTDDMRRLLEED